MKKGLMLKDVLLIKNQLKNLIIVIIGLSILFLSQGDSSFIMAIIPVYLLMLYISTFSYDDYNHFDTFAATLPYKRKDIVTAKFMLLIFGALASVILLSVIVLALSIFNKSFNPTDLLVSSLGTVCGVTVVASVFTPFIYKFGIQKGRMAIFGILVAITLLGGMLIKKINIDFSGIENYLNSLNVYAISGIIIIVMTIILGLSYLISCKIYSKKEF